MENRVKGKNIEIDYQDTLSFFNSRGSQAPLKHKYNYVLFQDEHPELAIERDQYEKHKICDMIDFKEGEWVLDIGCGVGRWGEEILSRNLNYVGIDYSEKLLEVAKDNLKEKEEHCTLIHCAAQSTFEGLTRADMKRQFDKVFINGVLMYLNDTDLSACLDDVGKVINLDHGIIYIKETVATEERLTLNKFYSNDLKHDYTAIYRTAEDYRRILTEKLVDKLGFQFTISEDLYSDELKNRKETKDYYYILSKRAG